MDRKSVLIIGQDPALIDFSAPGIPEDITADTIMAGLHASVARLQAAGHDADFLLTRDEASVEADVSRALEGKDYDVIVLGAGPWTSPPMAALFERLMMVLG